MNRNFFGFVLFFVFLNTGIQAQELLKFGELKAGETQVILVNAAKDDLPAGIIELQYTSNGNLVLYAMYADRNEVWKALDISSEEEGSKKLVFQTDGNLVMYRADGSVAWAANCHGKGGFYMSLLADPGNDKLIITTEKGDVIWNSPSK